MRAGRPSGHTRAIAEVARVGNTSAPRGWGGVDDFSFAWAHAERPLRVGVPGPMTLLMPLRRGGPHATEDALVADLVAIVNREMRALVDAGCAALGVVRRLRHSTRRRTCSQIAAPRNG